MKNGTNESSTKDIITEESIKLAKKSAELLGNPSFKGDKSVVITDSINDLRSKAKLASEEANKMVKGSKATKNILELADQNRALLTYKIALDEITSGSESKSSLLNTVLSESNSTENKSTSGDGGILDKLGTLGDNILGLSNKVGGLASIVNLVTGKSGIIGLLTSMSGGVGSMLGVLGPIALGVAGAAGLAYGAYKLSTHIVNKYDEEGARLKKIEEALTNLKKDDDGNIVIDSGTVKSLSTNITANTDREAYQEWTNSLFKNTDLEKTINSTDALNLLGGSEVIKGKLNTINSSVTTAQSILDEKSDENITFNDEFFTSQYDKMKKSSDPISAIVESVRLMYESNSYLRSQQGSQSKSRTRMITYEPLDASEMKAFSDNCVNEFLSINGVVGPGIDTSKISHLNKLACYYHNKGKIYAGGNTSNLDRGRDIVKSHYVLVKVLDILSNQGLSVNEAKSFKSDYNIGWFSSTKVWIFNDKLVKNEPYKSLNDIVVTRFDAQYTSVQSTVSKQLEIVSEYELLLKRLDEEMEVDGKLVTGRMALADLLRSEIQKSSSDNIDDVVKSIIEFNGIREEDVINNIKEYVNNLKNNPKARKEWLEKVKDINDRFNKDGISAIASDVDKMIADIVGTDEYTFEPYRALGIINGIRRPVVTMTDTKDNLTDNMMRLSFGITEDEMGNDNSVADLSRDLELYTDSKGQSVTMDTIQADYGFTDLQMSELMSELTKLGARIDSDAEGKMKTNSDFEKMLLDAVLAITNSQSDSHSELVSEIRSASFSPPLYSGSTIGRI